MMQDGRQVSAEIEMLVKHREPVDLLSHSEASPPEN